MRRRLLRFWARLTGRVFVSDHVRIEFHIYATRCPRAVQPKFNPDLIIGKPLPK